MESNEHSIVIVEDEGLIAVDLRGRLERAGYRVPAVAGTAVEALDVIREKSPDLILMDIRLRGNADGIQVAEQVRREFDIPVVYLTAYEDRKTLQRASQTQAFGYIKKPIDGASLQGSIEMAISKHRHERNLRQQRDWFSSNFAAVPDAVMVADCSGRICYVNPVAEEVFGSNREELLGRPYRELFRIRYNNGETVEDLMPVALLQETAVELPSGIWLEGGLGRRYAIEGSLAPRRREGRTDGVVIIFKDVTLRRFEEEHHWRESRHDALSRLADGIAGHLDIELSAVVEENTKLLSSLPREDKLRSHAEAIHAAAQDAAAVTGRLRAFGQDRETKPHVVHVNEMLLDLVKTWLQTLPALTLQLDPNPRPVHADLRELTGALEGLLRHAEYWAGAGRAIAVAALGAELEGLPEWVLIRVSYQSRGEDAGSLERVFDPSWDGNWDGLPAVSSATKRMGAMLRARLEADRKVVFEIYLPSVEIAAAGASPAEEGAKTLLLIEPNSEVRRLLEAYFEQHGYSVLGAKNCAEALHQAQCYQRPIPLVIGNFLPNDEYRAGLVTSLEQLKPGISVRLIEGYRAEGAPESENVRHSVTKRQLLEWANEAFSPSASVAALN